jgi:hypothetical protein
MTDQTSPKPSADNIDRFSSKQRGATGHAVSRTSEGRVAGRALTRGRGRPAGQERRSLYAVPGSMRLLC